MNTTENIQTDKQILLIVLDGWGYREETEHNAVLAARTPVFDEIWKNYPHTLLEASGLAVGLPEGQMGNSEVGHMTIGAGKALDQDLVRISKSIETGDFDSNPAFTALFDHVRQHNSTLHVQGLLSDGGVHSHIQHLFAFLRAARKAGIARLAVHVFTDGRDTAPQSAGKYLKELEQVIAEVNDSANLAPPMARIATISGRFYAMDRDNNWDRLAKATDAVFECKGNVCTIAPSEYVEKLYASDLGKASLDEHIEPIVVLDEEGKGYSVSAHDAVLFFNFRADRARMLSQKIMEKVKADDVLFATLTEYDAAYECLVAFPTISIETTLAKEISAAGLTQAHIAETEKFPHATYFLNGGVEKPYPGEEHIMLESRKDVATHDMAPKMRAEGIADKAIDALERGVNFIFINFANPDMVGHTANVPAIIEAVEETDTQLGRVLAVLHARGGRAFVTADHGNAEVNVDFVTGDKHTSHTINPVPAIVTNSSALLRVGTLADITPTILQLFGIAKPQSMTGNTIVEG